MIYKAQEMHKLAQSKGQLGQEKEKVMEQIFRAASEGHYYTIFLYNDFADYRLIMAWLCGLGYRCKSDRDGYPHRFYVRWEK